MRTWIEGLGEENRTVACAETWEWEVGMKQREDLKVDEVQTRSEQRNV